MENRRYKWNNQQLRNHVKVLDGEKQPSIILKNATYLNSYLSRWDTANIWIDGDRIVYVGDDLPANVRETEIIDCEGKYLVPGYIEPHAHPYQEYNPLAFAKYAAQFGTTTLINDNLVLFVLLNPEKAFDLLEELDKTPYNMYWWCRFDPQTELSNHGEIFHTTDILQWLRHESVVQGGELTAWPKLLEGDDHLLSWIQEAKRLNKRIEGHFPGASERTLAKLKLLGADCDHEAMTGREALARLKQGYYVSLRDSSIRPDLDILIKELLELGVQKFDRFFVTTDGSHPYFYENGMTDALIKKLINHGVPVIDAYQMASYNIANYYNLEHLHGSIATGRIANINILGDPKNPAPESVLAKGKWVKWNGGALHDASRIDWAAYRFSPLSLKWSLTGEDFHFANPLGIHLINNVITKPYETDLDLDCDGLPPDHDECFLMMVAKDGSWRINTVVKGFAENLGGLASSYSGPEDLLLIGKNKQDMRLAFERMKEIGGGIVLAEDGQIIHEIPLPLIGRMSDLEMEALIPLEKKMIRLLKERGFRHEDPAFTLSFFSATHLPFIRLTPHGLYDVKNRKVLVPPEKRQITLI
ncbi:adenine deaminase C-terminal domain-containing protein [Ureibacillus terrenus]|uniref:adenine deaminase C-terminal domain-containing protein n=1 Tax=Ureibacillus terrenus TaxID=118246 RepID=UPI002E1C4163|nr:adenine deaminase C-terminal domain-containing protein [Ureibacillus terrenus]